MIAWCKFVSVKENGTKNRTTSLDRDGLVGLDSILHLRLLLMIFLFKFGLPRAVDEVEVGLGRLLLHIFPHQVFHPTREYMVQC